MIRRELMDAGGNWWTDTELNSYLDDWQDQVQDELEFTWGTATATLGSSTATITLTDVDTDILRPGYVLFNNKELTPVTEQELDVIRRDWRLTSDDLPVAWYQNRLSEVVLWPTVGTAGTLTLEYPLKMSFAADTSTSDLPQYTRYSAKDYCCFRSYLRHGPAHSLDKAAVYKARYNQNIKYYLEWRNQYLPERYGMLQPGTAYERKLVDPVTRGHSVAVPTVTYTLPKDETPSGTVNGVNDTFTLTESPSPTASLKLFVDGVMMTQGTHYTLAGATVTFGASYIPVSGQTIFASYRYGASN
jgi:hypothetical protein